MSTPYALLWSMVDFTFTFSLYLIRYIRHKKLETWGHQDKKTVDDIFSHFNIIHKCDTDRMDGETPVDGQCHTYS